MFLLWIDESFIHKNFQPLFSMMSTGELFQVTSNFHLDSCSYFEKNQVHLRLTPSRAVLKGKTRWWRSALQRKMGSRIKFQETKNHTSRCLPIFIVASPIFYVSSLTKIDSKSKRLTPQTIFASSAVNWKVS